VRCGGTCKKCSSGLVPTSSIFISFHELFHKNKGQVGFYSYIGGFIFHFDTFIGGTRKTTPEKTKGRAVATPKQRNGRKPEEIRLKQQNPGALIPEKSINDKKYGVVNAR